MGIYVTSLLYYAQQIKASVTLGVVELTLRMAIIYIDNRLLFRV